MTALYRNRILTSLPGAIGDELRAACEKVDLPLRTTLVESNAAIPFVYFLDTGLASVIASSRDGAQQIEVGHIGFEGMAGFHVLMGVDQTPAHTFMQVAGAGWRVATEVLRSAVASNEALRDHLLRYVHTYQLQLAYSALANGRYTIPERLARWLLMCHDRLGTDAMPLTHEFLALILGVRRSGVTNEVHVLEGEHAIRATRGVITIRDRAKLEQLAGDTYGIAEAEYEAMFGPFRNTPPAAAPTLAGKRILIVEDDFDLATQLCRHFAAQGATIVGPVPSVQDALRLLIATAALDVAVVDINLRGEMAFPLAEALRKRAVPFVFVSGYGQNIVPRHLADIGFFNKPVEPDDLTSALLAVA